MPEDDFLSDKVRETYQQIEKDIQDAISRIAEKEGLDRDVAELTFFRNSREIQRKKLQQAVTSEEFFERLQSGGDFEFEGPVVNDTDLLPNMPYVHYKQVFADGVKVTIWAEEDKWDSYACSSQEAVQGYRIIIEDYVDKDAGISFLIQLTSVWTKGRIMQEFDDIVRQVKDRVYMGTFEVLYGEMDNVVWGSPDDEDSEE